MKIACITPDNKRDYTCEQILEGFASLGHQLIVSDPGNGINNFAMSDVEFLDASKDADLLLIFFGKQRGNRSPRRYLANELGLPKEKIFYICGSEWSCTGWESGDQATASLSDPSRRRGEPWIDEEMFQKCGKYFKRECYPQDLIRGIIPLPFAMAKRHIMTNPINKDIDIFCSFGHTKTGMRREAIEVVQNFKKKVEQYKNLNIVVKNGMSQEEYTNTLKRSRIVIDAFGGGDTNDRFWEGVGAQACVLYQRYNIVFPNPFEDWKQAVSWSNVSELANCIERLAYGTEANQIGIRGFNHALQYHTVELRAKKY